MVNSNPCRGATLIVLFVLAFGSWSANALTYTVTDLGSFGGFSSGRSSDGLGVNNSGQVTGYSYLTNPFGRHAFLYDDVNGLVDLHQAGESGSTGTDVNDNGWITGYTQLASTGESRPFIYDDVNGFRTVETPGLQLSYAFGINNNGWIVGYIRDYTRPNDSAFIYDEVNGMRQIGTIGTFSTATSRALAINDQGWVTGVTHNESHARVAYIYDEVNGMREIPNLGVPSSTGTDINNLGQVVGYSEFDPMSGYDHAFLWDETNGTRDLGTLRPGGISEAYGLNNLGQVVGRSSAEAGTGFHAFLFDEVLGGMVDLNDYIDPQSGWLLREAHEISDSGYITGFGEYTVNGETYVNAFLLTPVDAPIPEPATLSILVLGLGGLVVRFRRRHVY